MPSWMPCKANNKTSPAASRIRSSGGRIFFFADGLCDWDRNCYPCIAKPLFFFRLDTLRPVARRLFQPFRPALRTNHAGRNVAGLPQLRLPQRPGHDYRRGQGDERPADRGHGFDHERRRHAAGHHLQGGFLPHAGRLQMRPHLPRLGRSGGLLPRVQTL